jgi:TPR repeat protein
VIGFSCFAAAAETSIPESAAACDRAAASPFDKDRPAGVAGVAVEKIEPDTAIQACEVAAKAAPSDDRIATQLGRAHLAAKNYDAARMQFDRANRMGNALAAIQLAIFYEKGLGGLPADDVEALRLYKRAADTGLSLGQLSLGRRQGRTLVQAGRRHGKCSWPEFARTFL